MELLLASDLLLIILLFVVEMLKHKRDHVRKYISFRVMKIFCALKTADM